MRVPKCSSKERRLPVIYQTNEKFKTCQRRLTTSFFEGNYFALLTHINLEEKYLRNRLLVVLATF